ncbi:MAG: MarR family transcriptional regulator [Candidatus Ranarchaeia archaeon]
MVTKGVPVHMEQGPVVLPRSAYIVYKAIEKKGRITPKSIIQETGLTPRTVRFALTYLKKHDYVKRTPCLADMRQNYYSLK